MAHRKSLSPRKKPLQRRSQEMVDVILEAATRVFIEEGYERTSTNKIAQRAGVSVGSLYQYFPNKEAVTAALFDQLSAKAIRLVQERLGKLAHAPLPQAISEAVGVMAELYQSSPELIEMTFERLSELERTRQIRALRERSAAVLLAYLQTRQDELRPGNLPHMSWVVSSAVETLVFRVMQETPTHLSQKKLLSEIGELIGRYLTD